MLETSDVYFNRKMNISWHGVMEASRYSKETMKLEELKPTLARLGIEGLGGFRRVKQSQLLVIHSDSAAGMPNSFLLRHFQSKQ